MQLKKQEAAAAAKETSGRTHRKYKFISQVNSEVGFGAAAPYPPHVLERRQNPCAHAAEGHEAISLRLLVNQFLFLLLRLTETAPRTGLHRGQVRAGLF